MLFPSNTRIAITCMVSLIGTNNSHNANGVEVVNLGTGRGHSVKEVITAFAKASGRDIPYVIAPRRKGDIATSYASTEKAKSILGWQAKLSLDEMCADTWRWQSQNPEGYGG